MVTVDKNEEYFANMVGSKGEVTRAKNANDTGLITFRLQHTCLLYTSPSPRDGLLSRMPSSA